MATPRQNPAAGSLRGKCGASKDLFNALHKKRGQKQRDWRVIDSNGDTLATANDDEIATMREWYRGLGVQIVRAA